mmetsp:Transcript_9936/g.15313  ORF Transcript_9936/g.15313 Transcript_9936/m.15313 type:complete len:500 (-) Transcript_9936:50-1549(-)|eukprot:CAMPEP_0195284134 /NCGR_PEP_ID=MMETSP0707-20130614/2445_1 /TAXON_ID=33640 /ORGANISM="Asterionellopsis glacialis, Strain CCMP134" /LENGTH=499 /DNA_ID=CAMNT_0040343435 /DNA_START=122 /DNA_END=1621 /DNA_ORIENTATION=+
MSAHAPSSSSNETKTDISFIPELDSKVRSNLEGQLQSFTVRHASHHRPVALVTSGGTATDLEVNAVRSLDNFSTGLRGAISVEEFLKRGYAVIHLQRTGSASPFARVLGQCIGLSQANHGLSVDSLGGLFEGDLVEDKEDEMVKAVLLDDEVDPWLTDASYTGTQTNDTATTKNSSNPGAGSTTGASTGATGVALHRRLVNSSRLQRALRVRASVMKEGRLLTVNFRTVEEYLAKLQMCAEALRDSQSLAVLYLAAAVSDFYVPLAEKSIHKIQSDSKSRDDGSSDGSLVLKLRPVPKTLGLLHKSWSPDAFVVSFKLETDKTILRQKAERAVDRYGVHMVIGNLLQTRHERVWVLHPPKKFEQTKSPESKKGDNNNEGNETNLPSVSDWNLSEINKKSPGGTPGSVDALEEALLDFVVQQHFDYISRHWNGQTSQLSGTEAAIRTHERLQEKKRQIERDLFWKKFQNVGLEVAGTLVGVGITWTISSILAQRMHRQSR